jgi:hypothetical protein
MLKKRQEVVGHIIFHKYRHALKVIDKYPKDKVWLGMQDLPGEWAVAYHGTNSSAVRGIADGGLLRRFVTNDVCKKDAKKKYPSIPDVKGLYVATHCEGGASTYTEPFKEKDSTGATKNYIESPSNAEFNQENLRYTRAQ